MEVQKLILLPIKSHVSKMKIVVKRNNGVPRYYGWAKKMHLHSHMDQRAIIGTKKFVPLMFHSQVLTKTTIMLVNLVTIHNFGAQTQKGVAKEILQLHSVFHLLLHP